MPVSGIRLVDSNLWLALSFGDHAHHRDVVAWFGALREHEVAFCRITQMALLRHLTNAAIMGECVLSQRAAWECYDELRRDYRVCFLNEPPDLDPLWRQLTSSDQPRHRAWTDAYLSAFARAQGVALATVDRDFRAFRGLALDLVTTS